MRKYAALLFDLDETLVDSDRTMCRFLERRLAALDLPDAGFVDGRLRLQAHGYGDKVI